MEQLTVVGTEDGALVVAAVDGRRFRIAIDEALRGELRRGRAEPDSRAPRPSPREIQAHIRAGLTAEQVAELLGARIEDVARFERPVLAEREHIVDQALAVPVLLGADFDDDRPATFGAAVRAKLADAHASGERWSAWKEEGGWIVKVEFVAAEIEHDARWSFEPRRSTLVPQNTDATQLSRQGSLPEGLIPRLRALETPAARTDATPTTDDSRFDSDAFGPRRLVSAPEPVAEAPTADVVDAAPLATGPVPTPTAAQDAAIKRAPEESQASAETADLLEALRRRRGQRDTTEASASVRGSLDVPAPPTIRPAPTASSVALFDALEPGYAGDGDDDVDETRISPDAGRKRGGRSTMPSWDEIVFGARTDD